MKRLCSILVCALLILTACNGKKDYTGSIPEEFDAYCTSAFNNWKIPGMSVVVVKDGKVVDSIEVTSKTAPKEAQSAKEERIRENGGNYIKDPDTGELIRIPDSVHTRIERRE